MSQRICLLLLVSIGLATVGAPTARAAGATAASGPAIPIQPGDEPWVVTKLRVTDCRAVRGFVGAPVDGSLKSASWDGKVWEYPMPGAGAAVGYTYRNADGLHITFADDEGFNTVVVRGGIKARLLRDVRNYDAPETGQLVCEFPGHVLTSRAWFESAVKTKNVSFFDVSDGLIADCSFFRVRRGVDELHATAEPVDLQDPAVDSTTSVDPQQVIKLVSRPLATEISLTALGVEFEVDQPVECTISIGDPLNPRLELHG